MVTKKHLLCACHCLLAAYGRSDMHTEMEVANQTCYLSYLQFTDVGPTSLSTGLMIPGT